MNPNGHNVEDVLYGVRAIAKAPRTTPARVHELRARQGLPPFLSGTVLCARWSELAAWLAAQREAPPSATRADRRARRAIAR